MSVPAAALASPPRTTAATLTTLAVRDFRNLARVELDLPARGILLIGGNGHGKTNLLEAIAFAHTLRSVRGARDRDLVRFGADAFHLALDRGDAEPARIRIGVERESGRKRVTLDGAECASVGEALGALPSVTLSPRDAQLVTGSPGDRRRYLDVLLATTVPRYLAALQRYRAALLRRNAVLRDPRRRHDAAEQAALWEPALASAAAVLLLERERWVESHAHGFAHYVRAMGEPEPTSVSLASAWSLTAREHTDEASLAGELADRFAAARALDIRRGMSTVGPHRDDVQITLGDRPLRSYGSAGQQRTAALALRLLERDTVRERCGVTPLMLLDDPFAELDDVRGSAVMSLLAAGEPGQVILAVPKATDVPPGYSTLRRWHIVAGVVTPVADA